MDTTVVDDRNERLERFLLDAPADVVADERAYRWISEHERWHELVVCLFHETLGKEMGAEGVRETVEAAGTLGLLDIADLAANGDTARLLEQLLSRTTDSNTAKATVIVLVALCRSFVDRHGGLPQRYLRRYGEIMLAEATRQLDFGPLDDDTARRVMTHWLQNALAMPLSLVEPPLLRVCDTLGVSFNELREGADRLGINLALLDDVARTVFHAKGSDDEEE